MPNKPTRPSRTSNAVPQITVARPTTTSAADTNPKTVLVDTKALRRAQNEEILKNKNIKAFLDTLADAEGAEYDFKYGALKGRKNDKWRITDYSLPPSPGFDHVTTASGRYQINKRTWMDYAVKAMGFSDFSPHTQDLTAVEILRAISAIDPLVSGNLESTVFAASGRWQSLPQGPGLPNRPEKNGNPSKQPYKKYEEIISLYKSHGGLAK